MHPVCRIMRYLVFLTSFLVYATSQYSSVSCSPDVVQVCCYSTSPPDYSPKCYPCPSNVYNNALLACVNVTEMPRNITFKQANCMEKNCEINIPSPSNNGLEGRYQELAAFFSQLFSQRTARSVSEFGPRKKRSAAEGNVVKVVKTLVTGDPGTVEFAEPEYM